jgi:3-hydroxyisobutyrate dehydrogenase-like beta-hydroxyacid dehydrogenase
MKQSIGLVGVGLMGGWLARHLLAAGFTVTAHDIDAAKVDAIVQAGGKTAGSPDQIPAQVDVIILSLPNSHIVNEVVQDSLQLFATGKGLIVQMPRRQIL